MLSNMRTWLPIGLLILATGCHPCQRRPAPCPPPCPPGPPAVPVVPPPPSRVAPPPSGAFSLPPGAVLTPPPGAVVTPAPGASVMPPPAPPPGATTIPSLPPAPVPAVPGPGASLAPPGPERVEYRWTPAETREPPKGPVSRVLLFPPEVDETPRAEPKADDKPDTRKTGGLPVGIARFAAATDKASSGLRPSLDEGLDWLAANGYRAVIHVRDTEETDSADRKQVEKRGLRYVALDVNATTLSKETVDEFIRLVKDEGNQPLFVYDRDGSTAGALWYLYYRIAEEQPEDVARVRAGRLGLRESGALWDAARKLAP